MFGGFRIAVAVHLGGTRRVPGATKTIVFVDPAAPGSPQTTIFVDPAPPGASKPLDLSIQRFRTSPSGLQELREMFWKGSKTIPMPFKTFLEPLRNHWGQLLPYSGRLRAPAANQCLQIPPLPDAPQSPINFKIQRPWGPPDSYSAQVSCTSGGMPAPLVKPHCFN